MAISSTSFGTGLDINTIVSQLMTVEQQPLQNLIKKETSFQSKLSALGTLKSSLSTFQSAVKALSDPIKFQALKVSSSDSAVASATASVGAAPGSFSLEVSQLAQAQKLVAAGQASTTATIGTGTITIDFGTVSGGTRNATTGKYTDASFASNGNGAKTITIGEGNNTLTGIRDAINNAKVGVTATIVNDGSGTPHRLVLTSNSSGKAGSMKITVDSGDAALRNLLSHDPAGAQALNETVAAQDAMFKVDGIAVSKATNTVTDAIQGMTLNLTKTNVGSPAVISAARDSSAIIGSVTQFVNAYNAANKTLSDLSSYNSTTKQAAALNADPAVRSIQTQLRGILTTPLASEGSALTMLAQVGVSLQKDGTLAVDNTKLQAAIDNNFSGIARLFAATGNATDSSVVYSGSTAKTAPGSYAVSVDQLAQQASATGVDPAQYTPTGGQTRGSSASGLNIDASNDTLQVRLDGIAATIALERKAYADPAELADAIQSSINAAPEFAALSGVTVTQDAGVITIVSNSTGANSNVSIVGGNGKTNLLGVSPTVTGGKDTTITAGSNNTFELQLDGVTATISLAEGNYTYAELASEIQSKINGHSSFSAAGASVTVTEADGRLKITSNRYGATSAVSVTGNTSLFGASLSTVAGRDVAGKINGVAAAGSGQYLTGATGDASEGLKLQIASGSTGARGTVGYTQGYAYQFDKLLDKLMGADGLLSSRTDGINASLKTLSDQKQRLADRLVSIEDRYRAQFVALDAALASMQTTSNYLTQQLASLSANSQR